jgi:Mpv17 / PMP22 family
MLMPTSRYDDVFNVLPSALHPGRNVAEFCTDCIPCLVLQLRRDFWFLLSRAWAFWVPLSTLNFALVSPALRVP